ncbi:hypothetical protein FA95DRAFT_1564738 [Auriscalpium vulgare]|uniref:Uncharacterized protein n=1 Tax=Auriscalpium vulgare TaxID=40419 RepID=A0ACB8RD98_9AGAM|nr:hypothetical protein FA95DRAFT_1564738 [Auriscalpium vulgare]
MLLNTTKHLMFGESTGDLIDRDIPIFVERYKPAGVEAQTQERDTSTAPLALIFLHGMSLHKETWEPTIQRLFEVQATAGRSMIAEAWTMDLPNHGEAAALKYVSTAVKGPGAMPAHTAARTLRSFIASGLIAEGTRVVTVGHSAGGVVSILSTLGTALDDLPYSFMILVEPATFSREISRTMLSKPLLGLNMATEAVMKRRDTWPSREVARDWLRNRLPWRRWDPRILDLFIQHGLKDLPTAGDPERVTLACPREHERQGYLAHEEMLAGHEHLAALCEAVPVHCIFGTVHDLLSEEMQQSTIEGRRMASIAKVEGGHLLVQEAPDAVAMSIWNAIKHETVGLRGKL